MSVRTTKRAGPRTAPPRKFYAHSTPRRVGIVGPGMITADQLLPSFIQMYLMGLISEILIAGRGRETLSSLLASAGLRKIFPDFDFDSIKTFPALKVKQGTPDQASEYHYRLMFDLMSPGDIVMVAVPDHQHVPIIQEAISRGFHVICVKSLCTNLLDARTIEVLALQKGAGVFIDLHKFADPYVLQARRQIRDGQFGPVEGWLGGYATMMEGSDYFRSSNFFRWFTREVADPGTYVANHYVDQVNMLVGMIPNRVTMSCFPDQFPQGTDCYSWSTAMFNYANGASFVVQNSLLWPAHGPTGNHQGTQMFFRGKKGNGAWLQHLDNHRGRTLVYDPASVPEGNRLVWGGTQYMQFTDRVDGSEGGMVTGYGFESLHIMTKFALQLADIREVGKRRKLISRLDADGVVPTVTNRAWLALVYEAMRLSIEKGGMPVDIDYEAGKVRLSRVGKMVS